MYYDLYTQQRNLIEFTNSPDGAPKKRRKSLSFIFLPKLAA